MRTAITVLVIAALGLAVIATRAVWEGGAAFDDGEAALARGDTAAAIAHYRRAARWYVPVMGATGDALDRLEQLGKDAETRGDTATALAAWQAERGALLAIRGVTEPFADRRALADRHLAHLLAATPGPTPAGATAADREAWHLRLLGDAPGVSRGALALAALGLLAWLAGAFQLARSRRGASTIALVGAGAAVWLVGLLIA